MLCVGRSVQLKRHHGSTEYFLIAVVDLNEISSFKMGRISFHSEKDAAPSNRRACAGVRAFCCCECARKLATFVLALIYIYIYTYIQCIYIYMYIYMYIYVYI